MSGRRRPFWPVRAMIARLAPPELRDEIVGDLEERYADLVDREGVFAAERWALRQLRAMRPLALRRAVQTGTKTGGGRSMWEVVRGHLKGAINNMRSRPAVAGTVIGTVALAIAGTTATFSVVNGVLLRPLPYPAPQEMVQLWTVNNDWIDSPNSQLRNFALYFPLDVVTLRDWSEADLGLADLGAITGRQFVHQAPDGAVVIPGNAMTSGMFRVLQVEARLGRTLVPGDDAVGAARVAVISHGFWSDRFGMDPDVLGSRLVLDGSAHEIVGVMPAGFAMPGSTGRVWVPLSDEEKLGPRDEQFLSVWARLAPGVSMEQAEQRVVALQRDITQAAGGADLTARAEGALRSLVGDVGPTLWFLLGAVGLVLLIACVNIANVMSVTALGRRREIAVKCAIGAGRGRVIAELLSESAFLALVGGLLGVVIAGWTIPALSAVLPTSLPRIDNVAMSVPVALFGIALTTVTALAIALLPALQGSSVQPAEMIRAGSRGSTGDRASVRIRSGLVITEVALAFTLVFVAGLLARSYLNLWGADRGFEAEGLAMITVEPNEQDYDDVEARRRFAQLLSERLSAIPGAEVAAVNQVPLARGMSSTTYQVERVDAEPDEVNVVISVVTENYLGVMRIPLLRGRPLARTDDAEAPLVVLVNRRMAEVLWPGEDPIGRRVRAGREADWAEVVGVVENVRHQGLAIETEPKIYQTAWQNRRYPSHWVMRGRGDLSQLTTQARAIVAAVSPSTPVRSVLVIEDRIAASVSVPRFRTLFALALAGLAAGLALLGVYGVVAFAVNQKRREIGVRMALGAHAAAVVRSVVAAGLRLAGYGIGAGFALVMIGTAVWADQATDFLHEVGLRDPATLIGIMIAVALVAGVAAWIPGRRAAAVDPVTVLNSE